MNEGARKVAFACVLLVALVIPIENVAVLPVVGSLGRLAGLLMVVSAVPAFFARGRLEIRRPPLSVVVLALFVLWSFAGLLWTIEVESTVRYVSTFVQLLVFVVIIWQVTPGDTGRRALQQAYVIGCWIAVADGINNFVQGKEAVFQRFAVSNTDPNDYALALALALPMAYELFRDGRTWTRVLNLLFVPAALSAIVLSASRGGTLAAAVALLAFPLGWRTIERHGRRAMLLLAVAALALVPFLWSDIVSIVGSNVERIGAVGRDITSGDLNERELIWSVGMSAFAARPLLGVGGGAFPAAIERVAGLRQLAHNTFISVAVETGAVGLALFVALIVVTAFPLLYSYARRNLPSVLLLATLLVGILPLTWEFKKPLWFVIALLVLVRRVEVVRIASAPSPTLGPRGALTRPTASAEGA